MGDVEGEVNEVVGIEVPGNDCGFSLVEETEVGVAKMVMRCASLPLAPSSLPFLR